LCITSTAASAIRGDEFGVFRLIRSLSDISDPPS
jgi:hypothetical protein